MEKSLNQVYRLFLGIFAKIDLQTAKIIVVKQGCAPSDCLRR